jgi:uncharacterized protein YggU (UPF0235/DUF167 family)
MKPQKTVSVRLTPKSSSNRIGNTRFLPSGEEQLIIYVTTVPEDGKANKAMIQLLAKHFNVASSRITILKGHNSRSKIINIDRD